MINIHKSTPLIAALLASGVILAPAAQAQTIFVPGTRQPGQDVTKTSVHDGAFATALGAQTTLVYPRDWAPFVGTHDLDTSANIGVAKLTPMVVDGDVIVGESQGAVVANRLKHNLAADPNAPRNLTFIVYADPANTDGGLATKLPFGLPGVKHQVSDDNTMYPTTTVTKEYDVVADAPDKPNLLSWVNAVVATATGSHNMSPDMLNRPDNVVTTSVNSQGVTNTHILVKNQGYVPIVKVLADLHILNEAQAKGTNATLKPIIDSGYNRPKPAPAPAPAATENDAKPSVPAAPVTKVTKKKPVNPVAQVTKAVKAALDNLTHPKKKAPKTTATNPAASSATGGTSSTSGAGESSGSAGGAAE